MAERVGFEPTLPFRVNTLSKRAPSATRPSLRRKPGKGDASGRYRIAPNWALAPTWLHFILWGAEHERKSSARPALRPCCATASATRNNEGGREKLDPRQTGLGRFLR